MLRVLAAARAAASMAVPPSGVRAMMLRGVPLVGARQSVPSTAVPHATGAVRQFVRSLSSSVSASSRNESAFALIKRIESSAIASEADLKAYVRALNELALLTPSKQAEVHAIIRDRGFSTAAIGLDANGVPSLGGTAIRGSQTEPVFVQLQGETMSSQIFSMFLRLLPVGIILGAMAYMSKDMILEKTETFQPVSNVPTRFAHVQGVDEAKEELQEFVAFLKSPQSFTKLGGKVPKGLLMVGPPGTGKTMLARAMAGEAGVPFFYASGSQFEEVYVGLGAKRVRSLFAAARQRAPCIVFIDEIDSVGSKRNDRQPSAMYMTLNQLLTEMDGFAGNSGIIVIAATNNPQALDPALVRPGRFDRIVSVSLPTMEGRLAILKSHLTKVPLAEGVSVEDIARGTPGMSGADLAQLVNAASLAASRDRRSSVTQADLEASKDRLIMGAASKSFGYSEEVRRVVAFHETGHALVARYTPAATPLHKATIIPRRTLGALGVTVQLPENDDPNWSVAQLLARLDVCMGGRVAEELMFGEGAVTLGASSDFQTATSLARRMVTTYGMSPRIGTQFVDPQEPQSPAMMEAVDAETKRLLEESYSRAKSLLMKHRADLESVAEALLEHETLSAAQIEQVLKGQAVTVVSAATAATSVAAASAASVASAASAVAAPSTTPA